MFINIFLKTLFRMISTTAARIDQLCMRYYSTQVCAQTQVHFWFPHAHNSMGRLCNTIGGRSGAGPKAFRAPQGTRAKTLTYKLRAGIKHFYNQQNSTIPFGSTRNSTPRLHGQQTHRATARESSEIVHEDV